MSESNGQSIVIRTSRGLSIAGTRITVYALLDYFHAGWPTKLIQDWAGLTDEQIQGVLTYLDEHRDEVEQEYQEVLQQAEAQRCYWEARNREQVALRPVVPGSPEQEALRAKLHAWKAQIEQS
jgi:uncharacterized protein (DUF433 family)